MKIGRVLGVTALLGLLGGLAGALGGLLIITGVNLAVGGSSGVRSLDVVFAYASGIGFAVGLIAGPTLAWTFLRRVPIWRAIGEPALGAGIAATLALVLGGSLWSMIGFSVGAAILAAVRLRLSHRSAPQQSVSVETGRGS